MTTCHLHLMGNQWHVSPGEHPSSDISSSPNENLTDLCNLIDGVRKGRDNKICNDFDALKPVERLHYTPSESFRFPATDF